MTIDIEKNGEDVTIAIIGRLDTMTSPALDKVINEEVDGVSGIIMDMKGLEYISSAGLRVLLNTHKKMLKVGFLKLTNVGESIMEVLKMTGFSNVLEIEQ